MIQVHAQWAGQHQDAATGATKIWAACWGTQAGRPPVYMAIWRHDPDSPKFGQLKDDLADAESHYLKMVHQKQRKGYCEIEFESMLPEYVPSFRQRPGQAVSEAMVIAQGGYPAFRPQKGATQVVTDLPLVGLQASLGADLDPDPVLHGAKLLDLLRAAVGDFSARGLLLAYQRAKIRLEVQAEFGRRKAQRGAAVAMLATLRGEMHGLLVG
jgi:hypothetical protein